MRRERGRRRPTAGGMRLATIGPLLSLRQSVGQRDDGSGGIVQAQCLGTARHARERVGVGAGLLEQDLPERSHGRLGMGIGDCSQRVLRGGSWVSLPGDLSSASRDWFATGNRDYSFGFRVARTVYPLNL